MSETTKYISRQNALKRIEKLLPVWLFSTDLDEYQIAMRVFDILKNELAHTKVEKDVAPVVHGHWEIIASDEAGSTTYECSACHCTTWETMGNESPGYNYCPDCGAKMDEEVSEDEKETKA